MQFSTILGSMKREGDSWRATVPDTWLQGRSAFGGLQAALALHAMRPVVPEGLALRVLQMTFVAPVPAGDVTIAARHLRKGKSTAHVEARILQGGDTAAVALGVFGASRPSRVDVEPVRSDAGAAAPLDFQFVPRVTPSFIQNFDVRWLSGGLPFTASKTREAAVEVSMPGERTITAEHVVAIADVPPPVALSYLDSPAPGSSLTWTFEMLTDSTAMLPPRGFRLDVSLVAAGSGYTSQSVMVWGPSGKAVALSRQSMVIFG
jgi:acyl-CoA thioesterase